MKNLNDMPLEEKAQLATRIQDELLPAMIRIFEKHELPDLPWGMVRSVLASVLANFLVNAVNSGSRRKMNEEDCQALAIGFVQSWNLILQLKYAEFNSPRPEDN